MPRVAIFTLGCKLNQSESAQWECELNRAGVEVAHQRGREKVDAVIVNTCAVTERAAAKSRHLIFRCEREFPGVPLIVAGCLAALEGERWLSRPTIREVWGPGGKDSPGWREWSSRFFGNGCRAECSILTTAYSRPRVKIQDGCSHSCTYCVIPLLRGRSSRSRRPEEVTNEVKAWSEKGLEEVILTGVNIGDWGKDLTPPYHLYSLIERLRKTGVRRVRLSSLEPWDLDDRLWQLAVAGDFVAPHLHIALQHTHPKILNLMGRVGGEEIGERVRVAVKENPRLAIGADIMVGFPGEGEEEFVHLYETLRDLPFAYLHIFPYSPRPGTRAAHMEGRPPANAVKERVERLRALSQEKRAAFISRQLGTVALAVPEHPRPGERFHRGITDNYLHIYIPSEHLRPGQLVPVRLRSKRGVIWGQPLGE